MRGSRQGRPGRLLVLVHSDGVEPGRLESVAAGAGLVLEEVRLQHGEPLPDPAGFAGIVSLGGFMSAYQEEEHPFLAAEKRYLRRGVEGGHPVLGICLGCQLLAEALGGAAFPAPRLEVGLVPVELTGAGRQDPVLGGLRDPVLSFHSDTFRPPPGGVLLARSQAFPQAFRFGPALGLQFHPEADPDQVRRWIALTGAARLEEVGEEAERLLARLEAAREGLEAQARTVLGAWLGRL